jgi:diguanylate cyclase (GGDEF)-like protein
MEYLDKRVEVLTQTRQIIAGEANLSPGERETLLLWIDQLIRDENSDAPGGKPHRENEWAETNKSAIFYLLLRLFKQQADELNALRKLSLSLTSSLDLATVLDAVVSEAMHLVENARAAHIFLYSNGRLEFGAALDHTGERNKPIAPPRPDGLTQAVVMRGEIIVVEDMRNHPLYKNTPLDWEGSIIGIPLKVNNTVVGVMNLSRTVTGNFSAAEFRLLKILADQAAVAISNASLHQLVSRQAYSDTLTGLPNRRALDERLEREINHARRTGFSFAVIMMDLDGFKQVNDTYGHEVGDQVLRALFNYLATGLRSTDFLARYGGDELTLILSQTDLVPARMVADKILEKLEKFEFHAPDGTPIKLGLSGGIAIYPIHAMTAPDLLRAADAALYGAKKYQRGSFMIARGFTGNLPPEK